MKKNKKSMTIADLKTNKTSKTEYVKKEKELNLTTINALKMLRVFVWVFICFVIVLGIFQIIRSKQPKIITEVHQEQLPASESSRATSFAESFVKDYLTFGDDLTNKTDYNNRLSEYTTNGVNITRNDFIDGYYKVIDTFVWNIERLDETKSNIIIKAIVEIKNNNDIVNAYNEIGQEVSIAKITEKIMYVEVPILIVDNKVTVNDYPTFKATNDKLNTNLQGYMLKDGETAANDAEKTVIKSFLNDFFKTYYGGTTGQILTFFKEKQDINNLGDEFTFESVKNMYAYKKGNKYSVITTIEIKQNDLQGTFIQQFMLEIEETEEKLLILTIKNRIE